MDGEGNFLSSYSKRLKRRKEGVLELPLELPKFQHFTTSNLLEGCAKGRQI